MNERILHVALRTPFEGQPALAGALRSISAAYDEIDWQEEQKKGPLEHVLFSRAVRLRPTLIFMQLQCPNVVTPGMVRALREVCAPGAVIVSWDGDLRQEPDEPGRRWFIELGKAIDCSLISNTGQLGAYRAQGIQAEYLQIGVDTDLYRPTGEDEWRAMGCPKVPEIVLLASKYQGTHSQRDALAKALFKRYGKKFAVYGAGWKGVPYGRPMLKQAEESVIYSRAKVAISMSIRNDLAHYTSDRLFRALCSGALVATERFPGISEVDFEQSRWYWSRPEELFQIIDETLKAPEDLQERRLAVSERSRALQSWKARMPELLRIVWEARERRENAREYYVAKQWHEAGQQRPYPFTVTVERSGCSRFARFVMFDGVVMMIPLEIAVYAAEFLMRFRDQFGPSAEAAVLPIEEEKS